MYHHEGVIHFAAGWFSAPSAGNVSLDKGADIRNKKKMGYGGLVSVADVWREEGFPRDTLAPVSVGVDDLMKTSHFACQIIWHLFLDTLSVRQRGGGTCLVSGSVWLTVGSCEHDWEVEVPRSFALWYCWTWTSQSVWGFPFFFKCSVQLKAYEPMGKPLKSIMLVQ